MLIDYLPDAKSCRLSTLLGLAPLSSKQTAALKRPPDSSDAVTPMVNVERISHIAGITTMAVHRKLFDSMPQKLEQCYYNLQINWPSTTKCYIDR